MGALRKLVGGSVHLMLNANQKWTAGEAVRARGPAFALDVVVGAAKAPGVAYNPG